MPDGSEITLLTSSLEKPGPQYPIKHKRILGAIQSAYIFSRFGPDDWGSRHVEFKWVMADQAVVYTCT